MIKHLLLMLPSILCAAQATPLTFSQGTKTIPWYNITTNCMTMYLDGQAIGDMTWSKLNNATVSIDTLYILPDHRRHGYAKPLLAYALSILSQTFKKAVLKPFPFERLGNKLTGQMADHPNFFQALPKVRRFYIDHGFEPTTERPYMARELMTHDQALAQAARPIATQTVAGELA